MKNQGISLISLIITIIVIIILAAIVLFNGLSAPNSANFAKFTQSVDNVSMAVMNRYANLLEMHGISGDTRTQEQIYLEVATGADSGINKYMGTTKGATTTTRDLSTGVQNIDPDKAKEGETNKYSIHMSLPLVRESDKAWYVTANGIVFNANGYEYDNKIYFSGAYYSAVQANGASDTQNKELPVRAKAIADAIKADSSKNDLGLTLAKE